ncbi:DUF4333 domain-containing protein [Nocardia wallacei]|uniref:DUF4333 domain-containing protein n=1 Tax=Nocardia wallacei TaxID=480035 RepID=A0A7G1KJP3_9NOCA|nr:DUF4333 domain-containing protein [Nocardia wallacei]BCK55455.1 hypothetical protein NWFMUON74_32270 [Nocardia wallacei]
MSGPYGPSDTPGPGEGRPNDPTQQWSGGQQQPPGQSGPTQQWGQQPGGAQPTQQWGGQQGGGQWGQPTGQPWSQSQPQQQQPPPQPQWGQQSQPSWPQQQPPQQPAWEPTQQQWNQPQGAQQWGQPQPGQQWGQQPQQQGLQPTGAKKKSRKGALIAGAAALVVVVVAVVLGVVFLSSDKLDNKAVQDGVQKVLKDSYGIDDVQNVTCPSGQKVEVGKSFDCTLKVGGEQKKVTVKITKDDGTYEVGRPN